MATVSIGGERWPVGGSLKYNTVLQLDQLCKEQGKWVEVAYVLPFFSLRNMSDLCPKGIDLGVKPSAPSCPLTLPPYLEIQTEIQTAHMEVQTIPLSVRPQTTLVSTEAQTIEVRDAQRKLRVKYRIKWRTEVKEIKKTRFLQSIPGIICTEQPERLRNSHTSYCLFMKHPAGEIISL